MKTDTLQNRRFQLALLKGVWIFSILAWLYTSVAVNLYPKISFEAFSPYVPIPTDVVALSSFIIAFAAFVLWEYLRTK
jgi:hypothetical protein